MSAPIYSTWHRLSLPSDCWAMDIDWVEFRAGKPVAFLEISKTHREYFEMQREGKIDDAYRFTLFYVLQRLAFQLAVLREFCNSLSAKGFVVIHDDDLHRFLVLDIMQVTPSLRFDEYPGDVGLLHYQIMNRDEYRHFLESF
jgi:hypothetical protein